MICHIIGCGTIGTNLSVKLCSEKYSDTFHIYDYDHYCFRKDDLCLASNSDTFSFPVLKTTVLKYYLESINVNTTVYTHNDYVTYFEKMTDKDLVIDCRDNKNVVINCDFAISFDSEILVLDPTGKKRNLESRYLLSNNQKEYLEDCLSFCYSYIKNEIYKDRRNRILYLCKTKEVLQSKD